MATLSLTINNQSYTVEVDPEMPLTSFVVSTTECMHSETIAELPVTPAAINLVIAMAKLAANALYKGTFEAGISGAKF
jgi:hypothetical protein